MPIQKFARAGVTAYKVQVRRRGFPSVFKMLIGVVPTKKLYRHPCAGTPV